MEVARTIVNTPPAALIALVAKVTSWQMTSAPVWIVMSARMANPAAVTTVKTMQGATSVTAELDMSLTLMAAVVMILTSVRWRRRIARTLV